MLVVLTMSSIHLDGGETSVIRSLGFGGTPVSGSDLKTRVPGLWDNELFNILETLIAVGYVCATRELARADEIDRSTFFVNPGYSRELRDALDPRPRPKESKRVRRV